MLEDSSIAGERRLFGGKPFRHIVSLGGNCEPALQLRRTGRHQTHGPFDWLVTPLDSVAQILADDGARLATRFFAANEGTSAGCAEYGVLYHHEFPRGDGDVIVFDTEAIERCRSKLRHKMERFITVCSSAEPVLFIRVWPETDLGWDRLGVGKAAARSPDLNALANSIAERFPKLDFSILIAALDSDRHNDFSGPLDPRIAIQLLPQKSEHEWSAADAGWGRLLDRIVYVGEGPTAPMESLYWF